jgi:hypothetical protein
MNSCGRPTASVLRVDMSTPGSGASAARSSTEDALFHGYSRMAGAIQARPCSCGGIVHADPAAPGRGVAQHNASPRHKGWRLSTGRHDDWWREGLD